MAITSITPENLSGLINADITIEARVHKIRRASGITLVTLQNGRYMFQSVYITDLCKTTLNELCEGAYIEAFASVKEELRAPYGFELTLKSFRVISKPLEDHPMNVSQPTLGCTLDEAVRNRTVSIKHPAERAILHIRSTVAFAFSEFMQSHGFVQISTPKITAAATDTDYIRVKYFDKEATLTHSPALYKIMAVGGLDRIYETGTGYSSKSRNSIRHLNEFTRLDFEFAYGDANSARELLTDVIKHITEAIQSQHQAELETLGVKMSPVTVIPVISHKEAMEFLEKPETQSDLDPTDEKKLCEYAKTKFGSNYIYITEMPTKSRPFYEKDNCGFVLLSGGIEIASGGEHISDYAEQVKKLEKRNIPIDDYSSFLSAHKYGLPPVCGAGIGLERFIMALLGLDNIRQTTLFTRDLHHIVP